MEDKKITHCNQCPNHCPIDAVQCGRGKKLAEKLQAGENEEAMDGMFEDFKNIHNHFQNHIHKHNGPKFREKAAFINEAHRSWRSSNPEDRERQRGRTWQNYDKIEETDELLGLMRACGHYTFHNANRKSGQGWIMHILSHIEQISQKELQQIMRVQPGSISELLTKMERAGFVEREKDENDKRRIIVKITDKGKEHLAEFQNEEEQQDLFAALDEAQKEQLKGLLRTLLKSWNRQ